MITSIYTSGAHVIVLTQSLGHYGRRPTWRTAGRSRLRGRPSRRIGSRCRSHQRSRFGAARPGSLNRTSHFFPDGFNSQRRSLVALAEGASVKTIKRHLPQLLGDLEVSGRLSSYGMDDYFDPVAQRLAALKIQSVHAVQATAGREGTVNVQPGTYVGSAWDGRKIDEWLGLLLASSRGVKKLEKLDRSGAAQRHLVIVLDPFTAAGLGIALGFRARQDRGAADHVIPSLSPAEPLTNLWILPSFDTWEGLAWAPESRWTILPASRSGGRSEPADRFIPGWAYGPAGARQGLCRLSRHLISVDAGAAGRQTKRALHNRGCSRGLNPPVSSRDLAM